MTINEKLNQELMTECDRLTEIIDAEEVGSEVWKSAYGKKLDILEKMQTFDKADGDFFTKRKERELTEKHNAEMKELEEKKLKQHLEVEEIRNKTQLEMEKEKQKVTWQRVAFEIGKLTIPLAISIIHYNVAQRKVFDFEEHGRITSTAGRELHLPKIFMK